ncbi:MAG: TonB-dependent receptor plug domain-containing protein, partial [Gemmatimonadetes bacterium]|nr:TonB-dependent receptor plug domain-containing protein [Gemmatimonadota bacterium]
MPIALMILPSGLSAQTGTVSGVVTNQGSDVPIPAVQVSIPALNISTLTGANGAFVLTGVQPGRHNLRLVRIGFRAFGAPVDVLAGETARLEFKMTEAALALDEIIVTGTAGQARRREVGNSIAQLNLADVKQPVQNLDQMLQGRSAGIVIPTGRSDMGGGSTIRLRGNASLSLVNYPLIYIDGVRQTGEGYSGTRQGGQQSMLADIDPATIDRVEIVKGPAATALYGTEAASGVIQIFTKKGTPGRTVWTFQTDQGVRVVRPWGSKPGTYATGILNTALAGQPTQPCIAMADAATIARGDATIGSYLKQAPDVVVYSGCHRPYHDMDPYLGEPWRQRYTLSVAGGSDLVRFFTSGSGEGGRGILPNDEDLRYQFRSNVSFRPSSKINIDVSSAYSRYRFVNSGYGNGTDVIYFQVVRRPLNGPASYDYAKLDSVLMYDINQRTDRMILGATATWQPLQGMNHKLTVGYDDARLEERFVHPFGYIVDRAGSIGQQNTSARSLSSDYVLSQQVSLLQGLSATVSAGGQLVQRDESNVNLAGVGLPGPGEHTVSSASALTLTTVEHERVITGGFLFQNMFAFRDRYFLTAGVRVDGNSAFGK